MPETTAAPKCRACIEQGIPGECTDPAHQVVPEIGPPDRARLALRTFVEHLDAAPSAAVLDALNSALIAYDPPPPEPPTDLRDALETALSRERAKYGHLYLGNAVNAVLAVVQAHVTTEAERARAEGAAEALRLAAEDIAACRAILSLPAAAVVDRILRQRADRIAAGGDR